MTFFYKRIYPVIWFGILAAFLLIALLISNVPFLIVTALLAIISYQFMKKMAFDLVDEVFDVGDALLVRNGGREERIALADIKNVNFLPYIPAAGHPFAAPAECVRRHDRVLRAHPHIAAIVEPDDRKTGRPDRCCAPGALRVQSRGGKPQAATEFQCPLLGAKRTLIGRNGMSAFDPKRTFRPEDCCYAK